MGGQHLAERLTQLATGNVAVVFKNAWENLDTLVHEIGHSLSLPHIFEPHSANQYKFYQSFSDKVMDYTWQAISKRTNSKKQKAKSKKRMSFTRYQWYKMQKDTRIYRIDYEIIKIFYYYLII
ncbi:hypothetical protein [Psychrobacter fozii]|uniref:hypothetical protein n=1 Tax=Psychrobacter fozii TaxID=198480 RepID=UPI000DA2508D|nr:hypothetical protein [Psychrobacter fozii]